MSVVADLALIAYYFAVWDSILALTVTTRDLFMDSVTRELASIEELIRTVKPEEAESRCRELISSLPLADLHDRAPEIRATVNVFLPKRKRRLFSWIDALLTDPVPEAVSVIPSSPVKVLDLGEVESDLRDGYAELSERHIFQWSTFYRDFLRPRFDDYLDALVHLASPRDLLQIIQRETAAHAHEIFKKGYEYTRLQVSFQNLAVTKSLAGLQRFLELPIELYSAATTSSTVGARANALRLLCSALLSGILEGYASVMFGEDEGSQLLPRFPRSWAHYLGFLTHSDLQSVVEMLEPGFFRDGAAVSVAPLAASIDELIGRREVEYSALPSLGQFVWEQRRLEIALHPPVRAVDAKPLEIHCYLDGSFAKVHLLEEAANRGVALIAGPLRADIREWTESHDLLRSTIVNTTAGGETPEVVTRRASEILRFAIARQIDVDTGSAPLTYNFARDFPLHNPFLTRYFHVYRSSVRDLLRAFERRNGVRLWCSVRRSGKTTACFDLSTTTGTSTVITQTCDSTDQRFEANVFYDSIVAALEATTQVRNDFFSHLVERCSPTRRASDYRYVFVLDEYETFFERLRIAVKRNKELRYTVVQPLLNQMVAFSRENLLVFIGQRPDAHFILMDQNQLSAYIEQDTFPLFAHGSGIESEFRELLKKVLTERVAFDQRFADGVYGETAGHPFLTVKLLIELFDWMIKGQRPVRGLHVTEQDFVEFARDRLNPVALGTSTEYSFFRAAIAEALSSDGRSDTPWLHAVYSCLRHIAEHSPDSFRCSRNEFNDIVARVDYDGMLGFSPEYLLSTGAQANFFTFNDQEVWPKVPLLARISRATRPRLAL